MSIYSPKLNTMKLAGSSTAANVTDGRTFTDENGRIVLTVGTLETITLPTTYAQYVVYFDIQPFCNVWVLPAPSPTLTAPSGTYDTSLSQLNPKCRRIQGGTTIQLLATFSPTTTAEVGIEYYVDGFSGATS
jgi:hypothetical protein